GVAEGEPRALGPLRAPGGAVVPDPRPGEVVLGEELARRLDAGRGDVIVLRAPVPGAFPEPEIDRIELTGTAGPVPVPGGHDLEVGQGGLGLLAFVRWTDAVGPVTIEARSPSGVPFANESATAPVSLVVEPPLEEGTWRITVRSDRPVAYVGGAGVAYPPPSLSTGASLIEARVSGVAEDGGRLGISFRPVALVPLSDLQRATGTTGLATDAYVAVPRGNARVVEATLASALPADGGFEVSAAKLDAIDEARRAGADITGFLLVMGGFTLIAALLLAYALFSSLVEERRAELGIARALGLTRGEVALSMTLEGALYAAAAALAGLLFGLAFLASVVWGIATISEREGGPEIGTHVSPGLLAVAWILGTLVPLATIGIASLRFARLDPARAIRGIPEDPKGARRAGLWAGLALVAFGALVSFGPIGRLAGLPIALFGLATILAARGWRVAGAALAFSAVALVGYTLYTYDTWPEDAGELDPIMTMTRGAVLALGLSALAVASPAPYEWVARLRGRRRTPPRAGFVALRYLVARRRPAGLTMGMISLVVVVVTVMGTLFLLFSAQIPQDEGGYTVIGESPLLLEGVPSPLPADVARQVERADLVDRHFELREPNLTRDGVPVDTPWWFEIFYGVTPGFAQGNRLELVERAPQYADDAAVWNAVVRGEAVVIPARSGGEDRWEVGTRFTLEPALGRPREYVVAASARNSLWGVYVSSEHVRAMGFPTGTMVLVRVAEGADPDTVAHRLTAEFADEGVTFHSVPEEARRAASGARAAILVFESFLGLGLFVGLAATGFLASRAVHERIRDIGTLRALGFEEKDVQRAFMLESTLTAGVGLLVGLSVGLVVAHSVWWREIREEAIPFRPPWTVLVVFVVAVLALAALASRGPAKRASELPPAQAVRYVE
ncbi:MAG TPA: FtsX-like permease family protein, partial [Candidatus Thermoplasmatota archaeon]|nr:FtsX-like permease family protein [Candidatus Thermoplasmatota archaeon]